MFFQFVLLGFFNRNILILNSALPCRLSKNMVMLDIRIFFFQHVFQTGLKIFAVLKDVFASL